MTLIANYSLVSFNSARNTLPKVPRPIWLINSNYYNVILVGRLDHIINDFFLISLLCSSKDYSLLVFDGLVVLIDER